MFIFAHSLGESSPWSDGPMILDQWQGSISNQECGPCMDW
jgi:hypothetical protein